MSNKEVICESGLGVKVEGEGPRVPFLRQGRSGGRMSRGNEWSGNPAW